MASILHFLLIFGLSITTQAQHHRVVQVVPDIADNRYRENCTVDECYTIAGLVKKGVKGSNIDISFLPGIHIANHSDFRIFITGIYYTTDVSNVTLRAANSNAGATVLCNGTFGFAFMNVTNLNISGLTLEKCGEAIEVPRPFTLTLYYTLYIVGSGNVNITDVTVRYGKGYGLYIKQPHGHFTLSRVNFAFNENNFYFSTSGIQSAASLTVADSEFTHGMRYVDIHCTGIILQLLHTGINVAIRFTNNRMDSNNKSNMYIEYNVCNTNVDIDYLNSSNSDTGLFLVTKTTLAKCSVLNQWTRLAVSDANFTNTRIHLSNEDELSFAPLHNGVKYMVIFSRISVIGGDDSNEMSNNHVVFLHDATFENTRGITVRNVTLMLEGQFLYTRNHFAFAVSTSFDNGETGTKLFVNKGCTATFTDNVVRSGFKSTLHVSGVTILMDSDSHMVFKNNTGSICGGMLLTKSIIRFHLGINSLLFSNNRGQTGGAMALYDQSQLDFRCAFANLQFVNNHASEVGGAVYIDDIGYFSRQYFLVPFYVISRPCPIIPRVNPEFNFENNTALLAGSALYGGWIDSLAYELTFSTNVLSDLVNDEDNPSLVASDPTRVCLCMESNFNCSITELSVHLYPGETYVLSAVAVGQRFGTVPSIIIAQFNNYIDGRQSTGELDEVQQAQGIGLRCTNLTFTVRSSSKHEILTLTNSMENHQASTLRSYLDWNQQLLFETLQIDFTLKSCPLGFYFEEGMKRCSCQKEVLRHRLTCDLSSFNILRPAPKWINATFIHTTENLTSGVIVHNHCPFDYCTFTEGEFMYLDLERPDDQCAFNRSGILCGGCQTHFSHVLGTSRCKVCPRPWIALIIPSMALAGVALVVFLIALNLTVSTGTISGLIFYANIVRANSAVFFPPGVRTSPLNLLSTFLSTFIAWINLDLGVEVCLYNGLTAYDKTWLQFLFPLYIWLLVIVIIIASHYSTIASKLCGNSAVQVLATLFLLSYAKLLRLIITIFSSTELVYPDGYVRRVWLYDGNVDYLKGKHIPLFAAGLALLLFVSIPYTTVLLFIQCFQKWSFFKPLFWVGKLHPLFDAYTGPYKLKHRYWTGLLLLVRVSLFLVFSLNSLGDPSINLLSIVVVTFSLLAYTSLVGGIYKLWLLNVLENMFFLNLGVLSSAVGFYQDNTDAIVPAITCTSVGITFLLFVVISFYHLVLKIAESQRGRDMRQRLNRKLLKPKHDKVDKVAESELMQIKPATVTHTIVEVSLNEPLIKEESMDRSEQEKSTVTP